MIEVRNLSFSYANREIIKNASFSVERGDFLCITGLNGSGKTTLLKLILNIIPPTTGQIIINSSSASLSYVSQKAASFNSDFPAAVSEIVSLGLTGGKTSSKAIRNNKIENALAKVGMQSYKKSLIGKLSGGQQQRVFIAKALVSSPDILFLDEPTVGIDNDSLGAICCLLGDINKKYGITILMVTHDISSIINHATKILDVHQKNIRIATPGEFKKRLYHAAEQD